MLSIYLSIYLSIVTLLHCVIVSHLMKSNQSFRCHTRIVSYRIIIIVVVIRSSSTIIIIIGITRPHVKNQLLPLNFFGL